MSWTDAQRKLAMMAVGKSGMSPADRYNILRQCGERAQHDGRPSVKAAGLTDSDFEFFMSLVELECGGQIPLKHKDGTPFGFGKWRAKSNDGERIRGLYVAGKIVGSLVVEGVDPGLVRGAIAKATGVEAVDLGNLGELNAGQVRNALHALRALAKRHNVTLLSGAA